MGSRSPLQFNPIRRDRATAELGQVSDQPLTYTNRVANAISNASEELVAAVTSGAGRQVVITIPPSADTGVHIHFGAGDAVTTDLLLPPGFYSFSTLQRIAMIRGGAADVTVYWATAVA